MNGHRIVSFLTLISAVSSVIVDAGVSHAATSQSKKKKTLELQVVAPLIVDGEAAGELLVYPRTSRKQDLRVQGPALLEALKNRIPEQKLNRLSSCLDDSGDGMKVLSAASLRAIGLLVDFNESRLELHITIPAELRQANLVYLNGRGVPPANAEALSPSPVSAYLNAQAGQDIFFHHPNGISGRQPLNSAFSGALNLKSWVLEADATNVSNQEHAFSRGDVRLLKDDPERMIRYQLGDLSYPLATYQTFRPMAGFTVASNFSLQPYRVTVPVGSHEILLLSASKVVVFINGVQSQVLFLPAGRHDLRNLALGNGINFVRLEITDSVGRVEIVEFPWISESEMLGPGIHQFAYSVGAPSTQVGNHRDYNSGLMTGSAFHRYGVNDHLTIGANFQFDHNQSVGGLEALVATRLGTFGFEPVVSRAEQFPTSLGGRVRYLYSDFGGQSNTQRNFTLGLEYRAPHFGQLGDIVPNSVTAYDISSSYSQLILNNIAARLSLTYSLNRATASFGPINAHSETVSLVKSWSNEFQTTLTLSHSLSQVAVISNSVFALFSWIIPQSNHSLNVAEDSARQSSRVEWRYSSPQYMGGVNSSASYERALGANKADASVDYFGNRGTFSAAHDVTTTWGGALGQTTTLRAASALVFAGGRIGMGRPVTDSFAIVAAADQLSGQTIDISPNNSGSSEARTDWLGAAVLPNIRGYQYYNLNLDPSQLSPGLEMGRENYTFLPSYKSGVLIRAGTDSTVMLSGRLVDSDGQPLKLVSGEAIRSDQPEGRPSLIFTNRKGKFRMEGFRPGTYQLRLFDEACEAVTITIPPHAVGIYDTGVLKIRRIK